MAMKQAFVYIRRELMAEKPGELITTHTTRCTLQPDHDFRCNGVVCGQWAFNDNCIVISFRGGYSNGPPLNHIFRQCKAANCFRLVASSDEMYESLAGPAHNNTDEEVVLLVKVPEEIEFEP